jgi:predicted nucleic acid-binding protein
VKYVIDASVALRWVLEDEVHPHAETVIEKVLTSPEYFAVPELFGFEVLSVLFRLHQDPLKAYKTAIIPVLHSGLLRYPLTEVLIERSGTYYRSGLTGYDACYAALAEELQGTWITFDTRAVNKLKDQNLAVDLFSSLPNDWVTQ